MAKLLTPSEYVRGILSGDRLLLARAITLVESTLPAHRALAQEVMRQVLPHTGRSARIGITGVPGVGKSTFIEAFGAHLLQGGPERRLAVLTIDPTSRISGGSILGDKTRMDALARHSRAFIRPSPAGLSLGGVAARTREAMLLCEAAGFDWIVVETVGVGQSETAVHDMCDLFMLLLLPGAGDELQGIKRGIVEMADLVAVNKADGPNAEPARLAAQHYRSALHFFPKKENDWAPEVLTCSALDRTGLEEVWSVVQRYLALARSNGSFDERRARQRRQWFTESLLNGLHDWFFALPHIRERLGEMETAVAEGSVSPFWAAEELLQKTVFDR
jgi:LAO/AO transport system kinase